MPSRSRFRSPAVDEHPAEAVSVRLRGSFDRVEIDAAGEAWIVDYKTKRAAKTANELARHPQLGTYQLAVRNGALDELLGRRPVVAGAELVQLKVEAAQGPAEGPAAGTARRRGSHVDRGHPRRGGRHGHRRGVPPSRGQELCAVRLPHHLPRAGRGRAGAAVTAAPPRLQRREELRDLLGIPFTDEQLAAAAAPLAPGVIVAGAGSGKTSVMAARVVWLVGTGQVAPERVLGLTFTAKAAGELASRITGSLEQAGLSGEAAAVTNAAGILVEPGLPTVSTYHAFAGRLYTENALRLGLEPGARLLADATRFQLAARVLRRHRGALRHLTSPLRMLVGDLVALEAELSEHLVSPDELTAFEGLWIAQLEGALGAQSQLPRLKGHLDDLRKLLDQSNKRLELTRLAAELRAAKRAEHLIDFADQVAFGAQLAEGHRAVAPPPSGRQPASCSSTNIRTPRSPSAACWPPSSPGATR